MIRLIFFLLISIYFGLNVLSLSAQPVREKTTFLAGIPFEFKILSVYERNILNNEINLDFAYAKAEISNPQNWNENARKGKIPVEIDLVYTRYPPDSLKWITPFDRLLNKRTEELLKLDPALKSAKIKWNLIAQTACTTAVLAETFFHGWVIKYAVGEEDPEDFTDIDGKIDYEKRAKFYMSHVKQVINGVRISSDTAVTAVLERKKGTLTDKTLVVIDWTSSMYIHGAQVIAWNRKQFNAGKLKYLTLFNDGDDFVRTGRNKPLGLTGGIYFVEPQNIDEVLQTMLAAIEKGDGGDVPENNCEAVLKSIEKHPDAANVILIADAGAPIRDLALADKIKKPVHVILCGNRRRPPSPDYLTLAWKTGGSLSTMDAELALPEAGHAKYKRNLKLGWREFVFNPHTGRFENRKD